MYSPSEQEIETLDWCAALARRANIGSAIVRAMHAAIPAIRYARIAVPAVLVALSYHHGPILILAAAIALALTHAAIRAMMPAVGLIDEWVSAGLSSQEIDDRATEAAVITAMMVGADNVPSELPHREYVIAEAARRARDKK